MAGFHRSWQQLSLAEPEELTLSADALAEVGGDVHFVLLVAFD